MNSRTDRFTPSIQSLPLAVAALLALVHVAPLSAAELRHDPATEVLAASFSTPVAERTTSTASGKVWSRDASDPTRLPPVERTKLWSGHSGEITQTSFDEPSAASPFVIKNPPPIDRVRTPAPYRMRVEVGSNQTPATTDRSEPTAVEATTAEQSYRYESVTGGQFGARVADSGSPMNGFRDHTRRWPNSENGSSRRLSSGDDNATREAAYENEGNRASAHENGARDGASSSATRELAVRVASQSDSALLEPSQPNHSSGGPMQPYVPPTEQIHSGYGPTERPGGDAGLMTEEVFAQPRLPADCGYSCPRSWYAAAQWLQFDRRSADGITFSLGDGMGIGSLGYTPGARFTIGRIRDCTEGFEVAYTGGFEWQESTERTGPDLSLKVGAVGIDVSAFQNAQIHRQWYDSSLNSFEVSKKWWGWDVISTEYGVRYIRIGERYGFDSIDLINGTTGEFRINVNNNLVGPQVGMALHYPIGRWCSTVRGKAGIYANFVEGETGLVNAGTTQFAANIEKMQLGFMGELGYYLHFRLTRRITFHAGYEFWYVYGVAAAPAQVAGRLRTASGRSIVSDDDFSYGAGSAGMEITW